MAVDAVTCLVQIGTKEHTQITNQNSTMTTNDTANQHRGENSDREPGRAETTETLSQLLRYT